VLFAVLGPLIAPYSSTAFTTNVPFSPPSGSHILGGDYLARDVFSRVCDGGLTLLAMAVAATALGVVLGTIAGITAAYVGGTVDSLVMRSADVMLALPQIVFALLLVSLVGPKLWLIVIAVGLTHAPQVARVVRSSTLDVAERDFVKAVELEGVSRWYMMRHEILPNLTSPLMVESGLRLSFSIIAIAGLAFLGFGQQPPAANWGYMINENRVGLTSNVWSVVAPAVLIALLAIGTNTFTDAYARVTIGLDRGVSSAVEEAGDIVQLENITTASKGGSI
jgi:peptide/nickel transport system permease protein